MIAVWRNACIEDKSGLKLAGTVSIDGFEDTHDRIRGVPGVFSKALESLKKLSRLRLKHRNFEVYVNTVIMSENIHQLNELGRYLLAELDIDGHFFQIIRGYPIDLKSHPFGIS